jgi:LysM repeat protein
LSKIANKYGVTVAQLKAWNGLSSDLILIGQKLKVQAANSIGNNTTTSTNNTTTNNSTANSNTTSNTSSVASYTVVGGDYLGKIANKYGVTVAQLKAWNNLSSDLILVGQKLKVQATNSTTTTTTPSVTTTKPSSNSTATKTYQVARGDSLWKIAQANGLSVNALKAMNQLSSDIILIGQTLKLG